MIPAIAFSLALASVLPTAIGAVIESLVRAPAGWTPAYSPPRNTDKHVFTLALTMQNIDQLESKLLSVSTPGNPSYGKYMDSDDVNALFSASSESVSAATGWLKDNGITKYAVKGSFIDFAADIKTINSMMDASYQYYTSESGATKLRTLSYSFPESLVDHITLVDPGANFGSARAVEPRTSTSTTKSDADVSAASSLAAACSTIITPSCIKQLYNIGDYKPSAKSGSSAGYGSFAGQSTISDDVFQFEKLFDIPKQSFAVETINGGVNNQSITDIGRFDEANLDCQNIIAVSHPLPVTEFVTGGFAPFIPDDDEPAGDPSNEPYVPYYRYLLSKPNQALPRVISNSYGDEEDSVPYNYAVLACNMIGLMGLRGITIIESSGDLGVGAACLTPDNKTAEFNPIFPATCPYLTSVGGTVALEPEQAWNLSSGGFSKYFPRPIYQEVAISEYLKTVTSETAKYFSKYTDFGGRGFPDVAAHSAAPSFEVVLGGQAYGITGTSAAAPLWAGIVALLNDARLKAGKPTLGWLNPLIYAFGPEMLTDITEGYSVGCNGLFELAIPEPANAAIIPGAIWNATKGWDPVTGYGTPDFEKMKEVVLKF